MASTRPERSGKPKPGAMSISGMFKTHAGGGYVTKAPVSNAEKKPQYNKEFSEEKFPHKKTQTPTTPDHDHKSEAATLQLIQEIQPRTTYVPACEKNPDGTWTKRWKIITVSTQHRLERAYIPESEVPLAAKRFAEWAGDSKSE